MQDLTAKRTLVKSPPELWNELSEVERLARHLDAFGEIKITKLEPEHTVAWEGEGARGTVSIEPSGWGTKVTVTAQVEQAAPAKAPDPADQPETAAVREESAGEPSASEPEPEPSPEPEAPVEPQAPHRRGFFARLFGRRAATPATEQAEPAAPASEPTAVEDPPPEEPAADPVADGPAPEPVPDEPAADEPSDPDARDLQAILDDVLDALGSAHHRPFSRG